VLTYLVVLVAVAVEVLIQAVRLHLIKELLAVTQ
jgi:hypothetical protein